MRMMPVVLVSLLVLALSVVSAPAAELSDYASQAKALFTQENVRSMLDVTKRIKESGASYQPALTFFKGGAYEATADDADANLQVRIGALQFDALYAASFGQLEDVAACFQEQDKLLRKVNIDTQWDVSVVFPPEMDWMMREPDKVNFDEIIDAYVATADKYEALLSQPGGFALVEDLLYGFLTEGLYVAGQSVIMSDYDLALLKAVDDFEAGLSTLLGLYDQFADSEAYAAIVDAENFLRAGQRMGWLRPLYNMVRADGELSPVQVRAFTLMAAEERKSF